MRLLRRLLLAFAIFSALTSAASAIAAVVLRGRLQTRARPVDDEIELVAIFGSHDFTSTAGALRRATITALFGGGTLDLRLARLDPAGATLSARVIFGGYRIAVPGTWRVKFRAVPLIGGFGDARPREWVDPAGPLLTIEGFALFGGFGVVAETPDRGPARPTTFDIAADMTHETADSNRGLLTEIEQTPPAPAEL